MRDIHTAIELNNTESKVINISISDPRVVDTTTVDAAIFPKSYAAIGSGRLSSHHADRTTMMLSRLHWDATSSRTLIGLYHMNATWPLPDDFLRLYLGIFQVGSGKKSPRLKV
jgi:hypothetical protein